MFPNNDEPIDAEIVESKPEKKRHRRYFTAREFRFLKLLQENAQAAKPRSQGELLREAGYSPSTKSSQLIKDKISDVLSENDVLRQKRETAGSIVDDFSRLRFCQKEKKNGEGMIDDNAVQARILELRADLLKLRPPKKVVLDERRAIFHITPQVIANLRKVKGDEEVKRLLEE
jgi:hypothetical protein